MLSSKATATEKHGLPTPPNDSPPPPAYALAESNVDVPDITAAFSSLNLAPSVKPTPDVCIAHLKLLEAFHQLREDVTFEDGRFGINDAFADAGKSDQERAGLLTKIREKRWQVYVTKASKRFERWWTTCVEPIEERKRLLGRSKVTFVFSQGPDVGERLVWSKEYLPPLGEYHGGGLSICRFANPENRRDHGLACIHAQPQRLPRRLPPSRKDEILENWLALGSH